MLDLLRRTVGPAAVLGESEARHYGHGASSVVAAPANAEEAAAILSIAARENWSVQCAGAGTRLMRAAGDHRPDIVITTVRMTAITEYEPADLVVTAQAGVTLTAIAAATREHRQFLALDPAVSDAATIGGVLASAAAGPLRFAHGTPRDHALGLQVVAGDARVLHFGGKVVKNVAGYDVVRPLVGSRGTLGLITEISMRLKPLPEVDKSVFVEMPTFEAAAETAAAVIAARLDVVALEIVSPPLARAVDASGWVVVVRVHGNAAAVADSLSCLDRIAAVRTADARVWAVLKSHECEAPCVLRFAHLPSRLKETGARALRFAQSTMGPGARTLVHAGEGIVRLLAERMTDEVSAAFDQEREALRQDGGTLRVERGGLPTSRHSADPGTAHLMAGVKRVFDPAGTFVSADFA